MSPGETSSHVLGSPRRLAAILAADIAGFSRLMGYDEEGTLARVKRIRREIIDPTLAEHQGRLIKTTGDGFLVMFDSPLEAVRCAIVIQQSMVARNTSLPKQQWIQFRIGVNLGDVIVDPDDIFGDGVNIAARLESLAEPGGVYISGGVYEQVKNKLVCGYQSLGDEKLKNITDPVRIYRVLPDPASIAQARRFKWRRTLALGGGFAFVAVALLAVGFSGVFRTKEPQTAVAVRQDQQAPAPWTDLPARSPESRGPQGRPNQAEGASLPGLPPPPGPPPAEPPRIAPAPPPTATAGGPRPAADARAPQGAPQVAMTVPPTRVDRPSTTGPHPAFRDCPQCPEMVELLGGSFMMGSNEDPSEKPVHPVTVQPFAVGRFPVTVGEWKQCVAAKACGYEPSGDDRSPVRNLSWNDAQQYVAWLSNLTQRGYRLPTEAEWEYAARGGTNTRYWWGAQLVVKAADCKGCGEQHDPQAPLPVGSFSPNPFGLHDMGGGVDQWVSDCWHKDYNGAPANGASWDRPNCRERVLRGGSWLSDPTYLRTASRNFYDPAVRYPTHGLRVARSP